MDFSLDTTFMKTQHTKYSILDLALVSEGQSLKQTYNGAL
tara:strand:+ start:390 stop:509 length:120 start_codon:yes stop_codon:yes gene_type:complete